MMPSFIQKKVTNHPKILQLTWKMYSCAQESDLQQMVSKRKFQLKQCDKRGNGAVKCLLFMENLILH